VDDAAVLTHVEAWVDRHREHFFGPAISVGITDRRRTIGTSILGEAAPGVRLRRDHLFELASVSKSFTAALVMQESEAGRLAIDAPVTEFLPWFTPPSSFGPIRVEHLLAHTGGIATGWDTTGDAVHELLLLLAQEVGGPPGEHHVYSNAGYKALGLVLEAVSGRPWWELARERILEPLGMDATEPVISNDLRPRLAPGWVGPFDDRPWHPADGLVLAPWFESFTADGTICSTAEDVCAYLRTYLEPDGGVLSAGAIDAMTAPRAIDPDFGVEYGYGLWTLRRGDRALAGHTGSLPGYRSMILFDRTAGVGAVVLTNGGASWEVRRDLLVFALETTTAAVAEGPLPDLPPANPLARVGHPEAYVGTYTDGTDDVEVVAGDGTLAIVAGGDRVPLTWTAEKAFVARAAGWRRWPIGFEREGDVIVRILHGPRAFERRGRSVLPPPPADPAWRAYVGRYRGYGIEPLHVEVVERAGSLRLLETSYGEDLELVPLADGRFRVGREAWQPGRATFDAAVEGRVTRVILDGASLYRVPDVSLPRA
jgi:CubicO group peptidase (beta-lactamase class C family)